MPELPEAERARQALATRLGRAIAAVDDHDTYVSRPHQPGEIADALVGHRFASANRRGKFMWLETEEGPVLGLHLGMTGEIVLDPEERRRADRFSVEFEDGSSFTLRDRRRLGRAVLNPDYSGVGPDAAEVSRDEFRRRIGRGRAPIKARLLDQHAISGVGNLLADEILWQAGISPHRRTNQLTTEELDRLRRVTRSVIRSSIRKGGAHTGPFTVAREHGGACPRDGTPLQRDTVGGRTTYWCPVHQH
jgi:formamidopyrimidine-DNA glycosylase